VGSSGSILLLVQVVVDRRSPEQCLAEAVHRFRKRGVRAEEARRRLGVYNAMMLDGSVSPELLETVFHSVYPSDRDGTVAAATTDALPLVTFSTVMNEDLPPVEWDVEPIIARGDRAMFYG